MKSTKKAVNMPQLYKMLHTAIELEHSVIPPYLYAYWSVKDKNSEPARALMSVFKEEMNHMAMACNILNAVGGVVKCNHSKFIPKYPSELPGHCDTHFKFKVGLRKLDIESIVDFLEIERPREHEYSPSENHDGWDTIGAFYMQIVAIIDTMDDSDFKGGSQMDNSDKPDAPGILYPVYSKADARKCIAEIIEQGEGLHMTNVHAEENHFQRFVQLYRAMGGTGIIDESNFDAAALKKQYDKKQLQEFLKGIRNVAPNPGTRRIKSESYNLENLKFNSMYSRMLDHIMAAAESPKPDMDEAIKIMFGLGRSADTLMSIPINTDSKTWQYCGPSFQYIQPKNRV